MQTKKLHLSTINKIANKFELELVKGEGYFYWWGTKYYRDNYTFEHLYDYWKDLIK